MTTLSTATNLSDTPTPQRSQSKDNTASIPPSTNCDRLNSARRLYCLSFEYKFEYESDTVSFAYSPPYTYSTLCKFLRNLKEQLHINGNLGDILKEEKLATSVSGIEIPMLTISKNVGSDVDLSEGVGGGAIEKRKVVVIQARIHPGEANSSFVMQGIIEYLCSPAAAELRLRLAHVLSWKEVTTRVQMCV